MNLLSEEGFVKLEAEATRYHDIIQIMRKLKTNGYFHSLYEMIFAIFKTEHEFTLQALKQIQTSNMAKEFQFEELYKVNSSIFRNNFDIIIKLISDDVSSKFRATQENSTQLDSLLCPLSNSNRKQLSNFKRKLQQQFLTSRELLTNVSQNEQQSPTEMDRDSSQNEAIKLEDQQINPEKEISLQGKYIEKSQLKEQAIIQSNNTFEVKQQDQIPPGISNKDKKQYNKKMQVENFQSNLSYITTYHPEIETTLSQIAQYKKMNGRSSSQTDIRSQNESEGVNKDKIVSNSPQKSVNITYSHNKHPSGIELGQLPATYKYQTSTSNSTANKFNIQPTSNSVKDHQQQQDINMTDIYQNNLKQHESNATATLNNSEDTGVMKNSTSSKGNTQLRYYQQNLINNIHGYSHTLPSNNQSQISSQKDLKNSYNSASQFRRSAQSTTNLQINNSQNYNSQNSLMNASQNGFSFSQPANEIEGDSNSTSQIVINGKSKVYLPYSEFSYTQGGKFSKSERKLHEIGDNPGVGEYQPQEKSKYADIAKTVFGKSEKQTIFTKKANYKANLYYPSYHFVSKSPSKN